VRIQVVRSGGFAGLHREREVETEQLSPDERLELERLVAEAQFFDLPERQLSGLPDVLQYRVRVEVGGHAHEVTADDQTASVALAALVARVMGMG